MKVFKIIQAEVEEVEMISGGQGPEAIQQREALIKKYHSVLHPKHAFLTTLRYAAKLQIRKHTFENLKI